MSAENGVQNENVPGRYNIYDNTMREVGSVPNENVLDRHIEYLKVRFRWGI